MGCASVTTSVGKESDFSKKLKSIPNSVKIETIKFNSNSKTDSGPFLSLKNVLSSKLIKSYEIITDNYIVQLQLSGVAGT